MSSNAGTENIKENNAFSEHINCDSIDAVKSLLESCKTNGYGLICGSPYKLPPSPKRQTFRFMTMHGMNRIVEHFPSDQVISLETGIRLGELQSLLDKSNQWFPVYSYDENRSLTEFINSGDAGPLEHAYGEARDIVLGMNSLLGSGEVIKCGGKVVKNVTGYDLPKLFCGSHGTMQIPVSAHLRLYAKPETSITLIKYFKSEEEAFAKSIEILRTGLPMSCLELIDASMMKMVLEKCPTIESAIEHDSAGGASEETTGGRVAVCIQLHGMESVISTLKRELTELLKAPFSELAAETEHSFWKELARPGQSNEAFVFACCAPRKVLRVILEAAADAPGKLGWTARPSKYKALIEFADLNSSLQFGKRLGEISSKFTDAITIAHPTESLSYRAGQLPREDAILKELKRRIKSEYDPASILNPLAEV